MTTAADCPVRIGSRMTETMVAADTAQMKRLTDFASDTPKIGVWRIGPDGHYALKGLADDPIVTTAAEQAKRN
jgi:hypothetical protein